ncbi:MAG: YbaB/EbfC family nucleoid-associated protein [Anaerolineaceae bacterium]|nr:YbaB/EbfC family nucleoid-associated protein [Anaerolineaceae bacterium]
MAKGYRGPSGGSKGQGNMMAQLAKMQEQMAQAQAELADETVTETAGGGAVSVTMSGNQICKAVEIDPQLLEDTDAEMLQDLVLTAVNKALDSSRSLSEEKMAPFTSMLGGLGLGL